MGRLAKRIRHAFNTFTQNEPGRLVPTMGQYGSSSYGVRPDRVRFQFSSERSIISSIYTRISIDFASVQIRHVRLDDKDRYLMDMDSGLNNCLTVEANLDQTGRDLRQDIAMTMCDKGYLAVVPVDTDLDPEASGSYNILTMRVGEIVTWYPRHVRVSLWNEDKGRREEITLSKKNVAIIPNPLYAVMNEPNSTMQRLVRKLNLLDVVDEQSASGKLDLIIQLPYVIKTESKRLQAEQRREDIEFQLKGSKYGIAYTDGTEKITQLNRPAENNLMGQIEYLLKMLYGQLGITEEVMNGTADEKTMLNYWNRTIEPMVSAATDEFHRKFLTKTARSQKQAVKYFRDPFKLVPINDIAEIADKFTRNEIMSSNEMRQVIGMKPSVDPKADMLVNSNMPQGTGMLPAGSSQQPSDVIDVESWEEPDAIMNDAFDSLDSQLDGIFKDLGVDEDEVA